MKLIEIFKEYDLFYETDKHLIKGASDKAYDIEQIDSGIDKATFHSYVQNFYEDEFLKYKDKNISILEIGIQTGSSLKLWKEYFKNAENIVGVDISDQVLNQKFSNIDNVQYYFGDAYQSEFSKNLPSFDIIIDDGPHSVESQILALQLYLPKLKLGGVFVIEDVQSYSYFDNFISVTKNIYDNDLEETEYEVECLDFRETLNRKDDMMFIVRKK